ncbi:cell wall-binding repeat-containing protein [Candidatus Poriferisodalis sp.]|uniref:cell wall-binding repeat-containing protein n=1 Tax=Candidatus Poriferisodalis sp. TaxID=3101277 RepID=UPI003B52FDB0
MTGVGAVEEPAGPDETAPDAAEASADLGPEDPAGGVKVVRYAGSDRYAMSIELAQALVDAEDGTSEWVVLASGESWTDAAMAGPLAASLDAPVVLVPPGGLQFPTARSDMVEFLQSTGVRRALIVGSGIVLPDHKQTVLYGLGTLPRDVERFHGTDPVANAIAVAERIGAPAQLGGLGHTVIIASDQSIADAVAAGPLAAAGPFPLLLTAPDALDPRITTYLIDHEIEHVVLVGGTAAMAPAAQEAIETAGAAVTRLAGRDRIDTARLVADLFDQHNTDNAACNDSPIHIGLAPARHPERALTAGPLLAQACTSLRYTEHGQLRADIRNTLYLAKHGSREILVQVFSDRAAIPDSVVEVSVPPIRLATVARKRTGNTDRDESGVLVVDEKGERSFYAVAPGRDTSVENSRFTPSQFAWSPDGARLAIAGTKRMFVLDIETGEANEATIGDHAFRYLPTWHWPEWSPSSDKVAFTAFIDDPATCMGDVCGDGAYWNHAAEMFLYDATKGTTSRLTHNDINDTVRSWSPDGTRIAFTQSRVDMGIFARYWYPESLHIIEIMTGTVTDVYAYTSSDGEVWWSPDGSHLAFIGTVEELALILHGAVGRCGVGPRKSPSDLRRCMALSQASASSGGHLRGETYQCHERAVDRRRGPGCLGCGPVRAGAVRGPCGAD